MSTQATRSAPPIRVREVIWVFLFLGILAGSLAPLLIWSQATGHEISIAEQAVLILFVTWVCQLLRRAPLSEITGRPSLNSLKELVIGLLLGAALMLVPAALLFVLGVARWSIEYSALMSIFPAIGAMASVAIAEELLFRGFLFRRLIGAAGVLPAQLIIAALFLLTHLGNPGLEGSAKVLASINIVLASVLFGWACVRTKGLAMPIGLHFAANAVQGPVLGMAVSGNVDASLLSVSLTGPNWLTGGAFGLEASLPGLVAVAAGIMIVARGKRLVEPGRSGEEQIDG